MEYYIGIDIGGTNVAIGIVDAKNEIIKKSSFKTLAPRPIASIMDEIEENLQGLLDSAELKWSNIEGIGVACPGFVKDGVINYAQNLGFNNLDLKNEFVTRFGIKTSVVNDANAAAYAEAKVGAARGAKSVVAVTIGTGIGGGMVIDGKMVEGTSGAAAEIGHMIVVPGGRQCSCGNKGCFEAYCSASALSKETRSVAVNDPELLAKFGSLDNINGKTVFDLVRKKEPKILAIFDEYVKNFARGLLNIIALLEPDVIIIGGGLSKEGDGLLNPILEKLEAFGFYKTAKTQIKTAMLCNDAGIIGAALSAKGV